MKKLRFRAKGEHIGYKEIIVHYPVNSVMVEKKSKRAAL